MAWKPWYERAAEIENAQEREEFIRGALYGQRSGTAAQTAKSVLTGFLIGYGVTQAVKKFR
jgi:hypothetical protein